MSMLDEDFEEIDLNDEVSSITFEKFSLYKKKNIKLEKKVNIPILNKNTADPNTFEYEGLLKQMAINKSHVLDSNFVKTPSPRSDTRKTVERLIFNHQLAENKKQFLRKEKEVNELKSCTFSPKITNSKNILKKNISERQILNKISGINSKNILENEIEGKLTSKNPFVKSNNKALVHSTLKSHSQEHENTKSVIITPRNKKITQEGRPPIPKMKG